MREITRAQKARLGIFLIVAGGLLVTVILVVTGQKFLEKRDFYYVRYKDVSVSGLEAGAQVKYHGVRVGRVEEIFIDPEEVETIVVRMSLTRGTPVKEDVKAVISALSLTGLKIIELQGGSSEAPRLSVESEIPAGESTFEYITGKAEAVSEKLEIVLTNLINLTASDNQQRVRNLVDNTALVLSDVHGILVDNRGELARAFDNFESASEGFRDIAWSKPLRRSISNLDTALYKIQAAHIGEAVVDLQLALVQAQKTFSHIDLTLLKGRHDLLTSLEVLRESLDSFNEFARMISEDPSLLLRGTREEEISGGGRLVK